MIWLKFLRTIHLPALTLIRIAVRRRTQTGPLGLSQLEYTTYSFWCQSNEDSMWAHLAPTPRTATDCLDWGRDTYWRNNGFLRARFWCGVLCFVRPLLAHQFWSVVHIPDFHGTSLAVVPFLEWTLVFRWNLVDCKCWLVWLCGSGCHAGRSQFPKVHFDLEERKNGIWIFCLQKCWDLQ
jgi:hypothetical protein